jgi:hypothetical protein
MLHDNTIVCLHANAANHWASLGEFHPALLRTLPPQLFLQAHRIRDDGDALVRQTLFLWAAVVSEETNDEVKECTRDLFSGVTTDAEPEDLIAKLGLNQSLVELLQRCGGEILDSAGYRCLAAWSGWRNAGAPDSSRVRRLLAQPTLDRQVIKVVASAPEDLDALLMARSGDCADWILSAIDEVLALMPFERSLALPLIASCLSASTTVDDIRKELRSLIEERKVPGSIRGARPEFACPTVDFLSPHRAPIRWLPADLRRQILWEESFLIGVRPTPDSHEFDALAVLEGIFTPLGASAGFLVTRLFSEDGRILPTAVAQGIRDRLQRAARSPLFVRPTALGRSVLERLIEGDDQQQDEEIWG